MHRDMHAHPPSVSNNHTRKTKSQINTGKVQYVHVIYPKFIKQNGEITPDQNGKACRSPLLYCSFTPSRLQNSEKNKKRKKGKEK